MDVLTKLTSAAMDYRLSAVLTTHEKDKQQQLQISYIATGRLILLRAQVLELVPAVGVYGVPLFCACLAPSAIGIANAFLSEYIKTAKEQLKKDGATEHPHYLRYAEFVNGMAKSFCQNSNKWMNTLCLVSSCAMIVFGYPVSGVIGLASLTLIYIKQSETYSLFWLDRALDPLIFVSSVVEGWKSLTEGISAEGLMTIFEGIDILKRFEQTNQWLPRWINHPNCGQHVFKRPTDLSKVDIDNLNLKMNYSHMFNEKATEILPLDYKAKIDKTEVKKLFDDVQNRYITLSGGKVGSTLHEFSEQKIGELAQKTNGELAQFIFGGSQAEINDFVSKLPNRALVEQWLRDNVESQVKCVGRQGLIDELCSRHYKWDDEKEEEIREFVFRDGHEKYYTDKPETREQLIEAANKIQKEKLLEDLKGKTDRQLLSMVLSRDVAGFYKRIGEEKAAEFKALAEKPTYNIQGLALGIGRDQLVNGSQEMLRKRYKVLFDGFVKVRSGVEEGKVGDSLPPNFDLFKRMMKALFETMLEEPKDTFLTDFALICEMGESCTLDGWTKQVTHMLRVKTNDLVWLLHHQMSKKRSSMIDEILMELEHKKLADLSYAGGNLNAHVVNGVKCAAYSRFPNYGAEFYHQVNPREMEEVLWLVADPAKRYNDWFLKPFGYTKEKEVRDWNGFDTFFLLHELMHVHFATSKDYKVIRDHIKDIDKKYTLDVAVEEIYEAIKPKGVNGRQIPWGPIEKWLVSSGAVLVDDVLETVKVKNETEFCLSKKGVKLLLLDHGFLV